MKSNDTQLGRPQILYSDTQANIEALSATDGMIAYATDLDDIGIYKNGAWVWMEMQAKWQDAGETWVYSNATSFTVGSDKTAKYKAGTRIKLVQSGTTKYFVVVSSSFGPSLTTVTVTGGDDYSLAFATITSPQYAYNDPPDFPDWFNWTPTFSAGGSMTYTSTVVYYAKFKITGKSVHFLLRAVGTTGGTASASLNASLPAPSAFSDSLPAYGWVYDGATYLGTVWISGTTSPLVTIQKYNGSSFGLGSGRYMLVGGVYELG